MKGRLRHILSGLPVNVPVPTYIPLQKGTSSRDFPGKSNQENYHQADNVSGKERTNHQNQFKGIKKVNIKRK